MANGDMVSTVTVAGTDDSGISYQLSKSKTTASSLRVSKWRVPVTQASEVVILTFAATAAGSVFTALSKAVFINNDATNFCRIRAKDDAAHAADCKIPTEDYWVLNSRDINVSETSGAFSAFSTIDTVAAQADTAAIDLDVIIYHT